MSDPIPTLPQQLIDELNSHGIRYCCWKETFELDSTLQGEDDVDILVHRADRDRFDEVLASLHLKAAVSFVTFPWIFHFYGFDPSTDRFLHIHAHLATITGESHVKEFHLPLETMILENTLVHPSGLRIPLPEVELIVFLLRYYIKISCTTGAMLVTRKEQPLEQTFFPLNRASNLDRTVDLLQRHLRMIPRAFFLEMINALVEPQSKLRRVMIGLRLRRRISALYRLYPAQLFVMRLYQVAYRSLNKICFKRKKSLPGGGAIVAVTGLDGTGKSTVVRELHKWLGAHFNARLLHVGRPPARLETLFFRMALWIRKQLRGNSKPSSGGSEKQTITASIRYLVLAYERLQSLKTAQRLRAKGYIVLCDRYPSLTPGRMDSPQLKVSAEPSFLGRIALMERALYNAMPVPDVIFDLRVPLEVALNRNRQRDKDDKETDEELRQRYLQNGDLCYLTHHFEVVEATRNLPDVVKEIKGKLWARL